ncbi:hypothetical protein NQX30_07465 [Candidatus Persebacteraceae bacterium Df01]|uniref:Uncharacterized protein n=1 Tax=Candidatus Doriopsillibacter californiensis TaxID=2970740 RepID=A0ABT7QNB0_9GAMM|nr:hypothetical protein [Candidatus Persebacteraceae bacterium Df01]
MLTLTLKGGSNDSYLVRGSHPQFAVGSGGVISVTALQTIPTTHTLVLTLDDGRYPNSGSYNVVTVMIDVPDRARMLLLGGASSPGRNRWSTNGTIWVEQDNAFSSFRAGASFYHEGSVVVVGGLSGNSGNDYIDRITRSSDALGTNWIQTSDTAVASRAGMEGAVLNGTL